MARETPATAVPRGGGEDPLGFDTLVSGLQARFLRVPDTQLDPEIEEVLRRIVEFLGLDQGLLVQWQEDGSRPLPTRSWTVPGASPPPSVSRTEVVPWVHRQSLLGKVVLFSRVDELPLEAEGDKEFFRKSGTRSLISVPLKIGDRVVGALVLASLSDERLWPEGVVRWLQVVGDVLAGVLDRRKGNLELEARLRFERLLADISARFVNLPPDEVDREIEEAQRRLCDCLGFDRSTLWQVVGPSEQGTLRLRHVHQPPGLPMPSHPLSQMDIGEAFPWAFSHLKRGETVLIPKVDDLPPEAARDKECFRHYRTKSSAVFPLYVGGRVIAILSFACVREERDWPEALVARLRLVAQVFANALAHGYAYRNLHESEARLSLATESAGTGLWILEVTGDRLWVTATTRDLFHFDPEEDLTYESLLTKTHPKDRERVRRAMQQTLETGEELHVDYRVLLPDGTCRWVAAHGRSHSLPSGGPKRLMGVVIDITERKHNEEQLRQALEEVQRLRDQLQEENVYLRKEVKSLHGHTGIIGQSKVLRRALAQAEQVAPTQTTVLLLGETGTGKELIATAIHGLSPRRAHTMVRLNCAAIPVTLIESELFGREKGAYTGALSRQIGSFELAQGSTIFLDEVGDLPLELQAKLLRVLEEKTIQRVGNPKSIAVDVRVIAASNQDLEKAVQEGNFRQDLYYRLNVFPITLPPLRERREDIPLLVWAFVNEFAKTMGKPIESIPKTTMEALQRYPWPGNVRELRNVIERAMILATGPRLEVALPLPRPSSLPPALALHDAERQHIYSVLEMTDWRIQGKGGAAEILGLKRTTLQSRMVKLGLRRPERPDDTSAQTPPPPRRRSAARSPAK